MGSRAMSSQYGTAPGSMPPYGHGQEQLGQQQQSQQLQQAQAQMYDPAQYAQQYQMMQAQYQQQLASQYQQYQQQYGGQQQYGRMAPPVAAPAPAKPATDWHCPKCNNLNFAFRTSCNCCGADKPPSLSGGP